MTDTIASIHGHGYNVTIDDIKELGALSVGVERLKTTIGTTYLRALVRTAHNLAPCCASALDAVHAAHNTLYPAVLEGVITPDVAPLKRDGSKGTRDANKARALERNSRSNFARTAASALTGYVHHGGDLGVLVADIDRVTKTSLQDATHALSQHALPPELPDSAVDVDHSTNYHATLAAERRWWRAVHKLPAHAVREYLDRVQERIASEIASL